MRENTKEDITKRLFIPGFRYLQRRMRGTNIVEEGEIVSQIAVRVIRSWKSRKLLIQLIK